MARKKEGSKKELVETVIYEDLIFKSNLRDYCPRKIFDVLFLSEDNENLKGPIDALITTAHHFNDVTCITFITYEDILELINNYDKNRYPLAVQSVLEHVCKSADYFVNESLGIPTIILSSLMKLKLIEIMYQQYILEVKKMRKRQKLEENLNILTKECRKSLKGAKNLKKESSVSDKGHFKKGKSTDTDEDKRKGKNKSESRMEQSNDQTEDYLSVSIDKESDIIFDEDILNQVWFYVFRGFYDTDLLEKLIVDQSVPVTSIIKCKTNTDGHPLTLLDSVYTKYWNIIHEYFHGSEQPHYLEDTILMTYTFCDVDIKEELERFLFVIKTIANVKLQHLNYIRHLKVYKVKHIYNYVPLECLHTYNSLLETIPLEIVNTPIILDCLLKEVYSRVDVYNDTVPDQFPQDNERISNSSDNEQNNICDIPCGLKIFLNNNRRFMWQERVNVCQSVKNFTLQERDNLNMILNSYKKIGEFVYDNTMDMLKILKPFLDLNKYQVNNEEIIHKHDRDPSSKYSGNDDVILHIIYLFLFSKFEYNHFPVKYYEHDVTGNLEKYDAMEFEKSAQPTIIERSTELDNFFEKNIYEDSIDKYIWKENLSPSVLMQDIFKAQNEYTYMKEKFSPVTDNLLLEFSDRLDYFGLNTKIYRETLATPICLRDFCRYTIVERDEWLKNNQPPTYIPPDVKLEDCKGVERVNQLKMFQEYSHLLESGTEAGNNDLLTETSDNMSFAEMLEEINNYPPSSRLKDECEKYDQNTLLAYDFGTKYFQVSGVQTTFQSHDNVKVTVDNSRFWYQPKQCTFRIDFKQSSLILHSNKFFLKEDFTFHMNLSDGTIIVFRLKYSQKNKPESNLNNRKWNKKSDDINNEYTINNKEELLSNSIRDMNVLSMEEKYLKTLALSIGNIVKGQDNIKLNTLNRLKQATTFNHPVYKVTSNLQYLSKSNLVNKIPLANIMRRILHKPMKKKYQGRSTKRYLPNREKNQKFNAKNAYDIRLTLPNGLYISFYTSETKEHYLEVKQEFLKGSSDVQKEEFRLFSRCGCVLIKYTDATIRILKSNGDVVDYEKLNDEAAVINSFKHCHCKTVDDYRKKLNKTVRNDNEKIPPTASSRTAQLHTRKGYVVNNEIVEILDKNKVPYKKQTLLKFDGNRVCLESGKINQKKLYYTTLEEDFYSEEMYFERNDGFQCMFDKNGKQQVCFTDGTKISSSMFVHQELIDGYVYISLSYQFEHPKYKTVIYNFDKSLKVLLNKVVLKIDVYDNVFIADEDDVLTAVNKDNLLFEKTCPKCSQTYKCDINFRPLYTNEINDTEQVLHAQDSYNKKIFVDLAGNSTRNDNYIRGPYNSQKCNHYKEMCYKKLFIVNRSLSGESLWTDNAVEIKKADYTKNGKGVDTYYAKNVENVKFETKIFDNYRDRFSNTSLLNEQLSLSKYKFEEIRSVFCTTFQVVKKMINSRDFKNCLLSMNKYLEGKEKSVKLLSNADISSTDEDIYGDEENTSVRKPEKNVVTICDCSQIKISFADKINNWRRENLKYRELIQNRNIPSYFTSEFCQILEI